MDLLPFSDTSKYPRMIEPSKELLEVREDILLVNEHGQIIELVRYYQQGLWIYEEIDEESEDHEMLVVRPLIDMFYNCFKAHFFIPCSKLKFNIGNT